jgi:hypothetical protein
MLALILCGCSPRTIGHVVWNDHPTLQALMKMITSNRYRFPTVDSDDTVRLKMKEDEQIARDKVRQHFAYIAFGVCGLVSPILPRKRKLLNFFFSRRKKRRKHKMQKAQECQNGF